MKQAIIRIYAVLFSIIFGIVFTAQILGFLGMYSAALAIPLTLIVIILAYIAYFRFGRKWLETLSSNQSQSALMRNSIILACLIIVSLVFVQRMILWHQSSLGIIISPDFAGYHSIKAFQLFRDGSVWNLAIPYGQYPFGYESLIAFAMFFTNDIRVTGTVHALIFLLFWLSLALTIVRYSAISFDMSFLIALAICFVPIVFPQILNLGKNDVLLSLTILIAVLHAPVGDEHFHPLGLAFATMLSLATKATGLYILFYLWGLIMLNWGLRFRDKTWKEYFHPLIFLLTIILMFPGGLWVIRNYLILGELFTSEIQSFFQTSISANLDNPALYQSATSSQLALMLIVVLIMSILAVFHKKLGWQMAGTLLVMMLTFALTPLSAFLTTNNLDYLDVQWRFVLHGFVLLWIIFFVLIAPIITRIYQWVESRASFRIAASLMGFLATLGLIFALGFDDLFSYDANQWERLIDPSLQEDSIYDEIAILDSGIVYTEYVLWLPLIIRNPHITVTELRYPLGRADVYPQPDVDYIAFVPIANDEPTASIFQTYDWEIIFENETGRLYRRIR